MTHELLLSCARPAVAPDQAASTRHAIERGVDWSQLLRHAQHHGLLPLLAHHLNQLCVDAVPPAWRECLSDYCRRTEEGGRRATAELSRILRLFEGNDIRAFTFRGPALTAAIYGRNSFREFNALNFVVRRQSLFDAKALLVRDGYRPARTLASGQELAQVRYQCAYRLDRPGDRMHVWLHTQIDPGSFSLPLDLNRLRPRLRTVWVDREPVKTLSPEDLLITLCAYLVRPDPPRLCALADIARLVAVDQAIDWQDVLRQSRALGVRRRVCAALLLARDLLGASVPPQVTVEAQADAAAVQTADDVADRMLQDQTSPPAIRDSVRFHVNARERVRDRIRFCAAVVFTPTESDWHAVRLPAVCCPLYRAIRPLRLAGSFAGLVPRGDLAPFMPAPLEAVERMLSAAQVGSSDVVYDIGSGDGRIVIMAAKRYGARGIGIDIDAGRIAEAAANAVQEGVQDLVSFVQRDALELDLSAATVVTLYLGAAANLLLRPKLQHDLRPGTRVVSLTYDMADWTPMQAELVPHDSGVSQVFMWKIGAEEPAYASGRHV